MVTTYGPDGRGRRSSSFDHAGLRVLVTPDDQERNEDALALACDLSRAADTIERLRGEVEELKRESARLRVQIPPAKPARLMGGTPCVRFSERRLWLLGNRSKGWGSFGFWFASWDELFRHFDVRVTDHGEDEHGPYWAVENCGEEVGRG